MKRTSPPTAVTARPVATPGSDVRLRTSATKRRGPRDSRTIFSSALVFSVPPSGAPRARRPRGEPARGLGADGRDLPLELAHARLARVLADDRAQPLVGEREQRALEPVLLQLLGGEVFLGDAELLFLRVARELDYVHPVEERGWDRLQLIRGADEEHLREVERKVEVVVAEGRLLLGVEHLEHRARRVAAPVCTHLVDLVDQEDRVPRLGVAQRADDRAGQCADVCPPVTSDLCFVADAADRDAGELAAERLRDRMAERGLTDSGGADEAEDRPGEVALLELRDREVLDDPVLDLVEVVVVGVEDLARLDEVEVVLRLLVPGEADDPLDVRADDPVFGRGRRQFLEPPQFAIDSLARLLRERPFVRAVPELRDLGLLWVGLAELLLDRLQLLAQEVLALRGLHLRLDLVLDLRAELRHFELAVEDHEHRPQALLDVVQLEQLLFLVGLQSQRRGAEVAERARVVDVGRGERELLGEVRDEADQASEEVPDVLRERLRLGCLLVDVRDLDEAAEKVRLPRARAGTAGRG